MKIILLFFFVSSLWASEECNTSQIEISSDITDLAQSKCEIPERLDPCSTCLPPLLKSKLENLPKPTSEEVQRESLKVVIDEYKKVLIRNIVDLAKARTLPNSSHNFSSSLLACKAKIPTCSNRTIKDEKVFKELFGDLNNKIGSEIANIISKKPLKDEGLLTRTENACYIPEQTILQISANTIADVFDADLISILEKADLEKFKTVKDIFDDPDGLHNNDDIFIKTLGADPGQIVRYSKNNPYLKDIFSSPKNLADFIKSIPSPKTSEAIRNQIYSQSFGKSLDSEIAKRCKESFDTLTQFVCSEEYSKGEIDIDPNKNFKHLIGNQQNTLHSETPVDLFLEQKSKAKMFCDHRKNPSGLDLDKVRTNISNTLNDQQKIESPLSAFTAATYDEEFKGTTDLLCKEIQTDNCTDMTNMRCRLVANYKKTLVKDSPEYKMANSSNDDVNAVLRGMIADPAKLDPEVREVLVKEGILPDSKGNIAETGNIPERQPMVMGQASGTTQAKAVATSSAPASKATSTSERPSFERTSANFASPSRAPANAFASSLPPIPDYSDVYEKSDELKRFEEEIQRRLMGLDEPSKPKTVEQAKKVIRDAANSMPSRPHFRPNIENKMAERLLESQRVAPASKSPQDIEQEKIAQAAQDAKWEKELQNRAVSNMAGVRAALEKSGLADPSAKGSASTAQKKDLTKVALNIPEDPKVNLTEVFGKKFNANDPETEVLKVLLSSKNDFLLKINSLDFKIIFDENKQFKVLLQEGDKEEAFRIRPQLELFLKRLSDKNSAGKLSVDLSRN